MIVKKVEKRRQRFIRGMLKSKREGWKVKGKVDKGKGKVDKGRERLE